MSSDEHPHGSTTTGAAWSPWSRPAPRRRLRVTPALLQSLLWIAAAVVLGLLLGSQAAGVSQRYTKLFVGLFFTYILVRYPTYVALGVFLILFPFPANIQVGSTNLIFVLLLAIAWLVRSAFGREPRPERTPLDWAIGAYLAALLLSFVNVRDHETLVRSARSALNLVMPIVLYYTVVHIARSERKLFFLSRMFTVAVGLLFFVAFMERFAPGVQIIPRWYVTALGATLMGEQPAQRIGGILSHGMMGDLAAVACTHQIFMAIRSKGQPVWRVVHWLISLTSLYVISLTGNRGALIACFAGLLYFFWIFSREISLRRVLVVLAGFAAVLFIGEKTLSRFEGNITLLTRITETYVERGVPDTRRLAWRYAWERIMEKPILGHGPYYRIGEIGPGARVGWPHNAFLFYFHTMGLVGVLAFLALIGRVLQRTYAGHGLRVGEVSLARGMAAIWHIAIVQFLIGQLRTDHQRGDVAVYIMWFLFASGILAARIWRDEKEGRREPVAQPAA